MRYLLFNLRLLLLQLKLMDLTATLWIDSGLYTIVELGR